MHRAPGRVHDSEVSLYGLLHLYGAVSSSIIFPKSLDFRKSLLESECIGTELELLPPSLTGHLQAVNCQCTSVVKGMLREPWG